MANVDGASSLSWVCHLALPGLSSQVGGSLLLFPNKDTEAHFGRRNSVMFTQFRNGNTGQDDPQMQALSNMALTNFLE